MHGILPIDKPAGWTSHDVVARVRRLTGQRRAGHAGTLDPMATGVLLVCLGEATRLSELLMGGAKWYLARVGFGAATDTDDAEGRVVARGSPDFTLSELLASARRQIGNLQQVPPAYAAIKHEGVPAYRQARQGRVVQMAPRPVTVHMLAILNARLAPEGGRPSNATAVEGGADHPTDVPPHLRGPDHKRPWQGRDPEGSGALREHGRESVDPEGQRPGAEDARVRADLLICCSKGAYIRAIARDLGSDLGCGAHLAALRRLASGTFTVRECLDLTALAGGDERDAIARALRPMDDALQDALACLLDSPGIDRVLHGMPFAGPAGAAGPLRVYDHHGELLALAAPDERGAGRWHPYRVFRGGE